jgi:integrase
VHDVHGFDGGQIVYEHPTHACSGPIWRPLDPSIPKDDRAGAEACAASLAPAARASTKDGKGETVAAYSIRWLAERWTRLVSVKDDTARLRDHILPVIGEASVLHMTRDDVERVAVALALFTCGRDGEVAELHWPDTELEHGVMTITRARDRETGAAKSTKTGGTRRFSVKPSLLPMLTAMHAEAKGQGRVFAIDATHLSRTFRRWLYVAGRQPRRAAHDHGDGARHHLARPTSERGDVDGRPGRSAAQHPATVRPRGLRDHRDLHPRGRHPRRGLRGTVPLVSSPIRQ